MATGKFVSYLRVSTQRQGKSGLGLEAQRESVTSYLDGGRWKLIAEFVEVESGKRNDRPALAQALALCRVHKATLIIAKLDRLARNVHFISGLMESKVDFVAVDFPTANRLTVHILAAVAEHEAEMISKRTRDALQAAKRRGQVLGCRNANIAAYSLSGAKASILARQEKAQKRNADLIPVIECIKAEGFTTYRAIAAKLNERGIHAPRGGKWHPGSVRNVLTLSNEV